MHTLAQLLEKHQHNLLASAKIRAVIYEVAREWEVAIQMYEVGLFEVHLSSEQEETACEEWYNDHLCKDALKLLKQRNPELFTNC
jgi:hypothetical protein